MLKKLLAVTFLLSSIGAHAYSQHNIQPHFGLRTGQIAIGADYEYKIQENAGFGGYFIYSSDDDKDNIPGIMAIGGNFKLHVDLTDVEIYAAPGFGFAKIEMGSDDESFFGPSLKIGGLVNVAPNIGIGLEYTTLFNWSNSDLGVLGLGNTFDLALVTARIGF